MNEAGDSWCLTSPISGFSVKCQWELWAGDWWDLKAPAGNCVSAESGKNQILLTGCSCDWQSAAATRSVGRARSAGREITGRKTCPTKSCQEQTRARLCTPNVCSYCTWAAQAGFNQEKANKRMITAAEVCAGEWVVFCRDENTLWCHLGGRRIKLLR